MAYHSAKKEALQQDFMQRRRTDHEQWGYTIERAKHKCDLCRGEGSEVHHIIPVYQGGESKLKNLVYLCSKCHVKAHNGSFSSYSGMNEELQSYFIKLNEDRVPRSKKEIIAVIKGRMNTAYGYREHGTSKQALFFYSGKYHAYKEIIELLSELED
jgi:ribosomal protein L37AE/L43A